MTKSKLLTALISMILLIGFSGCKKVSELSDVGEVTSFDIVQGSITQGVILGDPQTTITTGKEDNFIYVNIHVGRHAFPIKFDALVTINETAEKILNINFGEKIIFEESNEIKIFYVVSESGKATKWQIKLRFDDLDEDANIEGFRIPIMPTGVILSPNPTPNSIAKTVDIFYIRGEFPFTAYANINTGSATSDFKGSFSFNSISDKKSVKVTAKSGFVNNWEVALIKTVPISSIQEPSKTTLSNVALNEYKFKPYAVDSGESILCQIDSLNATISLFTSTNLMNGRLISFGITPGNGSEVLGSQIVGYTQWREEKFVYLVDKETAAMRTWKIVSTHTDPSTIVVSGAKFESYTADNDIVVNPSSKINLDKKEIYFDITKELSNFNIKLSGLSCLVNDGTKTTLPESAEFTSIDDVINFKVISSDTLKKEDWTLYLRNSKLNNKAEITDFSMSSSIDWQKLYIEKTKKQITILSNQKANLTFIPKFITSKGASIESPTGDINNNASSSCVIDVKNKFLVVAEDGVTKEEWHILFVYAPQIAGTNFNEYNRSNIGTADKPEWIQEPKAPWSTANVKSPVKVIGTQILDRGGAAGDNAIRLKTLNQNTIIWGNVVAAATTYLGLFELKMNLEGLKNPRTMTKFGSAFTISNMPSSFITDFKYIPGAKYQQAVFNSGTAKYDIVDLPGIDSAHLFIELINYTLNGGDISKVPNGYSGGGNNGLGLAAEGVNIVSKAEIVVPGDNAAYRNWNNKANAVFRSVEANKNLTVTHLVITASSSKRGDKYIGAIDSEFWLDNLYMIYYTPEAGAIEKVK